MVLILESLDILPTLCISGRELLSIGTNIFIVFVPLRVFLAGFWSNIFSDIFPLLQSPGQITLSEITTLLKEEEQIIKIALEIARTWESNSMRRP